MAARQTRFQILIADMLRTGKLPDIYEAHSLDLPEDLGSLCAAFEALRTAEVARIAALLPSLCYLTTWVSTPRQRVIIFDHVLEPLLEIAQRLIASGSTEPDAVLNALAVLVDHEYRPGEELLVKLVRQGYAPSDEGWLATLQHCSNAVLSELADPLPPEPLCKQLLMACSKRFENSTPWRHPFETPQGRVKLAGYLNAHKPEDEQVAIDAAIALGGFRERDDSLLALAASHPSAPVRVQAARAMIAAGDMNGLTLLAKFTADPAVSNRACALLEEIGREDAISPVVEDEGFLATADLYEWLSQDQQRGRAPDAVEVMDTRQMYWPPLEEDRVLRLFRFTYVSPLDQQPQDYVALVGGIGPHSFFQPQMVRWSLGDIYAYHCSWEHLFLDDPGVDESRCSIEHGRDMLAKGPQDDTEDNDE